MFTVCHVPILCTCMCKTKKNVSKVNYFLLRLLYIPHYNKNSMRRRTSINVFVCDSWSATFSEPVLSVMSACVVCHQPSQQRCASCHLVSYCSRQHQKQDWKIHKLKCIPYKVVKSPELGRHLVCLRAVSAGEIILQEDPMLSGPMQTTPPICLGCYKLLNEFNSMDCSRCGWPVCSSACERSAVHRPECEFTSQYKSNKVKIQTFQAGLPHPSYQCLTVLRCLYLKMNRPEIWKKLDELESHCKERQSTAKYDADKMSVAQFILRFFNIPDLTEEEILRVSGIVQVNAHEVPLTEPGYISVFNMTSFLEHSCRANCSKSFTSDGQIVIRAAVAISPGEHFSICYTDPLWGTASRKHHLLETKFFECNCIRCADVTEMGTHFDSLKCASRDCPGSVVPDMAITEATNKNEEFGWSCQVCGKATSSYDVMSLLEKVSEALSRLSRNSEKACKDFISRFETVLHPNHFLLTDAKVNLVQLCGQKDGLLSASVEDLHLKQKLCQELYKLATTLVPAENRLRGVLLFELYAATAEIGRRKSNSGEFDPGMLRENLLECKKVLQHAYELLNYEPEVLPEGKMALHAKKNLEDLDHILTSIHSALTPSPF